MTDFISMTRPFEQTPIILSPGGDMSDDFTSRVIRCKTFNQVRYQINYTDANSPIGVISVQTCESGVMADFEDFPLTSDGVKFHAGDGEIDGNGNIAISGVGVGRIDINLVDVHGFLMVKYTSGSAGVADLMQIIGGAN